MTKRGLFTTLFAVAISLIGVSSFAMAPTIRDLPDVIISDQEDNVGSDNNWFIYTSAFEFDKYVQDGDTTLSDLLWSFDEGDNPTPPGPPNQGWFAVNGIEAVHIGATGIASDSPTIQPEHVRPDLQVPYGNLRGLSTASFRDIVFSPPPGSPAFPNPTEDHASGNGGAGKVVRFYVSDGNNVATQDIFVKTIDNVLGDALSGGTCFDVDQTALAKDDQTFMTDVSSFVNGGTTGWTRNTTPENGALTTSSYDASNQALRVVVATSVAGTAGKHRINGFGAANDMYLPWASVDSDEIVRVKWYMFSAGQTNPADVNQIPNFRLRASQRFAVNSMLEVFSHVSSFTSTNNLAAELRPSADPNNPSIYRVDLSPARVTAMNTAGEGITRAFEAYSTAGEPQENGAIECTESIIGTYKTGCVTNEVLRQTYQPTATDAGDLRIVTSASDYSSSKFNPGVAAGDQATQDTTAGGIPTYTENNTGVSFATNAVLITQIGVGVRDFDSILANASRPRVTAGKQYRIVWKLSSTSNANSNPQIRLRSRSLAFCWSQKFEIGGALSGGGKNNAIAQQALPGVGTQITSGLYTMILHTPQSADIQASQPNIAALPPYGSSSTSRRDIKVGFDVVDYNGPAEVGDFKVEKIEVYEGDLVSD